MNTEKNTQAVNEEAPISPEKAAFLATMDTGQLLQWLQATVAEWQQLNGQVFSVAVAGQAYAEQHDDSIAKSLFETFEVLTTPADHSSTLQAGLAILAQRLVVQPLPRAA